MRILVRHITRKTKGGATHQDQLLTGSRLTLGRGTDQDIHLPNLRVALAHAELVEASDGRIRLQTNIPSGFRYNGSAVQSAVVTAGDRIEIGSFVLTFGTAPGADLAVDIAEDAAAKGRELEEALLKRSRQSLAEAGLNKRQWALGLAGTIAVLFLLVPLLSAVVTPVGHLLRKLPVVPSDHAWSSGEVSQPHAHIAQRCESCHTTPFVPTKNEACLSCHERTPHHVEQPLLDAGLFEDFRCGSCHHEHTGKASIVRHDEKLCVTCHAGLKDVVADTKLANAEHFGDDHPQFKPTIIRQVGERRLELRLSLDDRQALKEEPNLEFPHDTHLKPDLQSPTRGKVKLACADCHVPEPGGGLMAPVSFEKQCHECHRLGIPGDIEREAPHGDLKAALNAVDDYFAAWALRGGYPNEFAPKVVQLRRRPGQSLTEQERQDALGWAKDMSAMASAEMLGYTTCGVCHKAEPTGQGEGADAWKLAPVNVPHAWFPKSRFSHGQHATQPCSDCHAGVEKSETSADINLPGIETCRECHGGANAGEGQLASTCITCHEFHRAKQTQVAH